MVGPILLGAAITGKKNTIKKALLDYLMVARKESHMRGHVMRIMGFYLPTNIVCWRLGP